MNGLHLFRPKLFVQNLDGVDRSVSLQVRSDHCPAHLQRRQFRQRAQQKKLRLQLFVRQDQRRSDLAH